MTMERGESFERINEGLKKAADCCRQLGAIQKNRDWNKIAFQLEQLLSNAAKIYDQKSLSRSDALNMIDARVKNMKDIDGDRI